MAHLSILYLSAGLHDLKSAQVAQGLVGLPDGGLDCLLDAARRRSDQFDNFVDMIRHGALLLFQTEQAKAQQLRI